MHYHSIGQLSIEVSAIGEQAHFSDLHSYLLADDVTSLVSKELTQSNFITAANSYLSESRQLDNFSTWDIEVTLTPQLRLYKGTNTVSIFLECTAREGMYSDRLDLNNVELHYRSPSKITGPNIPGLVVTRYDQQQAEHEYARLLLNGLYTFEVEPSELYLRIVLFSTTELILNIRGVFAIMSSKGLSLRQDEFQLDGELVRLFTVDDLGPRDWEWVSEDLGVVATLSGDGSSE